TSPPSLDSALRCASFQSSDHTSLNRVSSPVCDTLTSAVLGTYFCASTSFESTILSNASSLALSSAFSARRPSSRRCCFCSSFRSIGTSLWYCTVSTSPVGEYPTRSGYTSATSSAIRPYWTSRAPLAKASL